MYKTIAKSFFLIVFIAAIEAVRIFADIAITPIDALLFPLFVLIIVLSLKALWFDPKKVNIAPSESVSSKQLVLMFFSAMICLALGLWAIYTGVQNPLQLYTGVRGAAHGYTLFVAGLLIAAMALYLFYRLGQLLKNTIKAWFER